MLGTPQRGENAKNRGEKRVKVLLGAKKETADHSAVSKDNYLISNV